MMKHVKKMYVYTQGLNSDLLTVTQFEFLSTASIPGARHRTILRAEWPDKVQDCLVNFHFRSAMNIFHIKLYSRH